jgi:hypothetical protein
MGLQSPGEAAHEPGSVSRIPASGAPGAEAGSSHTHPALPWQAGWHPKLFAFGGPRSQRTNIQILWKVSYSPSSLPQDLGASARTRVCTHV